MGWGQGAALTDPKLLSWSRASPKEGLRGPLSEWEARRVAGGDTGVGKLSSVTSPAL